MSWIPALLLRTVSLILVWFVLAEGDLDYWMYAVPSVALAASVSLRLLPIRPARAPRLRQLGAAVGLLLWFLRGALIGGVDVAARAVRRPVDIDPMLVQAQIRLPPGLTRVVALWMLNLMPGTLVVRAEGDVAEIHALDPALHPVAAWEDLQARVAAVAGHDLAGGAPGSPGLGREPFPR